MKLLNKNKSKMSKKSAALLKSMLEKNDKECASCPYGPLGECGFKCDS